MDFVFPEVQGEGAIQNFLLPSDTLRNNLSCPPYSSSEVATLTVDSTKSAFISAAKQVDFPAEQGHHRGKRTQGDRCGRDDTVYQLLLQRSVVCKTKLGWRPITPQARGGQQPLPRKNIFIIYTYR